MTLPTASRRTVLQAGLTLMLSAAPPTIAATPASPRPLSADDKTLVDATATYLQNLAEVKGRFEQTDARGAVTHGDIYLKRPGRARFVYDPPSGLVVISDGQNVLVSDPRLKTADRYPLSATPLSLFLAKQVRLDRGVVVTAVDRFAGGYSLTARDAHHFAQGQIVLTFLDHPTRLQAWRLTDAEGHTTQIRLISFEATRGLDPALFVVPAAKQGHGA